MAAAAAATLLLSSSPSLASYYYSYALQHTSSSSYGPLVTQLCLNSSPFCYFYNTRRSSSKRTIPRGSSSFGLSAKRDRCGIAVASLVEKEKEGPAWLRGAVSAATELLRIFSPDVASSNSSGVGVPAESSYKAEVLGIQDVIALLQDDYKRSYFLTGNFSDVLYVEDCLFADPTIKFHGRDLYRRNLKLSVPFYEKPSLTLLNIKEETNGGNWSIKAYWKLSTYLKFPWRPLISVDGCTIYNLDSSSRIVKHVESWNISAFEALFLLFVPSDRAIWNK